MHGQKNIKKPAGILRQMVTDRWSNLLAGVCHGQFNETVWLWLRYCFGVN
jgi:hypothetical protein